MRVTACCSRLSVLKPDGRAQFAPLVVKHLVAVPTELVDHEIGQAVRNGVGLVPRLPGRSGYTGRYRLKMFATTDLTGIGITFADVVTAHAVDGSACEACRVSNNEEWRRERPTSN